MPSCQASLSLIRSAARIMTSFSATPNQNGQVSPKSKSCSCTKAYLAFGRTDPTHVAHMERLHASGDTK